MAFRAIVGTLKLRTPLHAGTGEGTETADDLVRRDARGRLLIPGTAIAGALRSLATRLAPRFTGTEPCQALLGDSFDKACQCLVCQLFGDVNPREDEEEGCASRLWIYDAFAEPQPAVQIRDGVGIDRTTGAAARRERIKFDYEIVPAGTEFQLRMELDPRFDGEEEAMRLLAAALAEWRGGRGVVGGRSSRGLGGFKLDDIRFVEQDLNQPETLLEFLNEGPPWDADGDPSWLGSQVEAARKQVTEWTGEPATPVARCWVDARFTLAAEGAFLTHDPVQAGRAGFDHAPLLAAYAKDATPVLPGSALRGVLRSQAERIARTLTTLAAWDGATDSMEKRRDHFLAGCPACNPLTAKTDDELASCNSFVKGYLSAVDRSERSRLERQGLDDKLCLACRLFGSTWNGSRLRVEDAPLKEGTEPEYKVLDFLAIDRFTGGGRDTAKFDAVVLWKPKFSVRLFLDNPQPWELGWLALVLRDLHEGLVTVGFGKAKGFGQCRIEDPGLSVGFLTDTDFPVPVRIDVDVLREAAAAGDRLRSSASSFSGIFRVIHYEPAQREDWLALAEGWVHEFNRRVREYRREDGFTLKNDSYFTDRDGSWLPDLYPGRVL